MTFQYNPYGPQLIIDSLKGEEIYRSVQKYNKAIFDACKPFRFVSSGEYDLTKNECSWWFDPRRVDDFPISHVYPNGLPVQKDPRFCLKLYAPNYFSLLLINTLYDQKDILIEDQCGGQGIFLFYLNKLGYTNLSLIENWSQLPKNMMESLLYTANIFPHLTPPEAYPKVINLVGYTYFVRPIHPETELVICYNNTDLISKGEGEEKMFRDGCLAKYSVMKDKVYLASEKHGLANAYCNKDKVEEFTEKLRKYEA